ncbi:hypothetical protein [Kitasatospora fiedleri]|uniref:hypothetical protein n=1 Tax=Kitasatospora fiedleri TaxID=2991545 RepID=UPI00249C24BF|nr:hypothetical protein [Kitasatospora fiedleri]
MVLSGIGVGLALGTLVAAGVASLPAHRAATGSALVNSVRQMSATVGVALLVAVVGAETGPAQRQDFRLAWLIAAALALVTAGIGLQLARAPPARAGARARTRARTRSPRRTRAARGQRRRPDRPTPADPRPTPGRAPDLPSGPAPEPRAGGRTAAPAADRSSAQHYHRADRDGGRGHRMLNGLGALDSLDSLDALESLDEVCGRVLAETGCRR